MSKGTNKAVEQTVRKLKTAQSTKKASLGGVQMKNQVFNKKN